MFKRVGSFTQNFICILSPTRVACIRYNSRDTRRKMDVWPTSFPT